MENKKIVLILLIISIPIKSCFITEKKVKKTELEKPEFNTEKKIIVTKFESDNLIETKIVAEYLPEIIYSYLKHIDEIPFSIDIATIKNPSFFTKLGYKAEKLSQKDKTTLIKYGLLSDIASLYLYPLFMKEDENKNKNISLPQKFKVKWEKFREDEEYKSDILFLTGNIKDNKISISIYDPYSEKTVFKLEEKIDIKIEKIEIEKINLNIVKPIVLLLIKKLMEEITKEKYYLLEIKNKDNAIIYINDRYINTDSVYLKSGKHIIKTIKEGYSTKKINIYLNEDSKIEIKLDKLEEIEIYISSIPEKAALFVDEKFIGLTPTSIKVLKGKTYNIRLSLEGFEHYNYKLDTNDEIDKKIEIKLKKYNIEVEENKKLINKLKNLAFYTFFPSFAAFIYTKERADYYLDKVNKIKSMGVSKWEQYNLAQIIKRENFFNNTQQFFKNSSIVLLITAGILQLFELEMEDIGVGVDQDKKLGIFYKW